MSDDVAIRVDSVSKSFRLPHEKHGSMKNLFVNLFRGRTTYEKQRVLKDVSFEIKKGEFFGIVGRNGSGKSTLLKLMAGIYSPDKGAIQVNGKLTPFIELGVGFNPELTGRENVFLNGALLGFSRAEMEAMYNEIVEFSELERFMDQQLKNYSSGMQVRLAFSIAIQANTPILLLDEVLAVGDASFQQKCFDYFEELKRENKTVILVSHSMDAVKRFCNKAVYLKNGKIIHAGSPADVADIYLKENMRSTQNEKEAVLKATGYSVKTSVVKQTEQAIELEMSYGSNDKEEMYIGIAIIRDGASFAEITTSLKRPLVGAGKVKYYLDTSILNDGLYRIDTALFKKKNRELIGIGNRSPFSIKGSDITRGKAIKLADTWKYE